MKRIMYGNLKPVNQVRNAWKALAEAGMQPDDMLNPDVWGNVAERLTPGDRIEVIAHDGAWWAEFVVGRCTSKFARVGKIAEVVFEALKDGDVTPEMRDRFIIRHRGVRKYGVLDSQQKNAVVKDGFETEAEAEEFREGYLRKQVA